MRTSSLCCLGELLCTAAIGAAILATPAAAARKASGPVVELPKMVVTDSRALPPPEAWRYATTPGLEILSNASDRATRQLITDFQLFRQALEIVWPMPHPADAPLLVILCGRGDSFEAFVPDKTEDGPQTTRASVFLHGHARSAIVVDVALTEVNILSNELDDPTSGVDSSRLSIEHNKQLYREYVHYLLSRSEPRLPPWFEEGMAQVVMAMQFDPKWIEFGRLADGNTVSAAAGAAAQVNATGAAAEAVALDGDRAPPSGFAASAPAEDQDFNNALAHHWIMPMADVFAVKRDSPEALNPLGNNVWAKECYAFVHLGLFGEQGQWRKRFSEFLVRAAQNPPTEQMFKDCFDMSYREMAIMLRGYIDAPTYQEQIYHPKDHGVLLTNPTVTLRDATGSEVGRIKGEAMLLAGHAAAARSEFMAPYIRGERDPQLEAELGLLEHAAGRDDRARALLTAATAGKCSDPEAYMELARMRLAEVLRGRDEHAGIAPADRAEITRLILTACSLPPLNAQTYDLLAEVLRRSSTRPSHADLVPLVRGVQMYPGDVSLVYTTATLCLDAGEPESARSLIDYGLRIARAPTSQAAFRQLAAALPAPTPKP